MTSADSTAGQRRGSSDQRSKQIAKGALLAVSLIVTALLVLVAASGADAYHQWRWYSQPSGCAPGSHTDPVGIVFLGTHAEDWFVDQEVQDRMSATFGEDWHHGDPSGQFLYHGDTGDCTEMTQSEANHSGYPNSRWHMRVGPVAWDRVDPPPGGDPAKFVYWSLGTPHYDKAYTNAWGPHVPDFGHCNPGNKSWLKGGSFNAARRHFKQGIRDGGPKGFIEIRGSSPGNTKVRHDGCDGEDVSSNGMVVWIRVGALPNGVSSAGPYTP